MTERYVILEELFGDVPVDPCVETYCTYSKPSTRIRSRPFRGRTRLLRKVNDFLRAQHEPDPRSQVVAGSLLEISRACAIISQMEAARAGLGDDLGRGAFGLETHDGQTEMIDEPMLKQVRRRRHTSVRSVLLNRC